METIASSSTSRAALLGVAIAFTLACGGTEAPREAAPANVNRPAEGTAAPTSNSATSAPDREAPELFEGTAGATERQRPGAQVAVLRAVRAARHDGFDRVVFEFEETLPGYRVEYVERPVRQCGSGDVVPLAGDGWLEVRFTPAAAHTEAGAPTVVERELRPGLPVVLELKATCDFEADVTWVAGVASPNRYRVLELANPPRFVVDVRH